MSVTRDVQLAFIPACAKTSAIVSSRDSSTHRCRGETFPAALRSVYLHDAAARQAADAKRDIQRDRPGGDDLYRNMTLLAEPHDRALAELPLDLDERSLKALSLSPARSTLGCCSLPLGTPCRVRCYLIRRHPPAVSMPDATRAH